VRGKTRNNKTRIRQNGVLTLAERHLRIDSCGPTYADRHLRIS